MTGDDTDVCPEGRAGPGVADFEGGGKSARMQVTLPSAKADFSSQRAFDGINAVFDEIGNETALHLVIGEKECGDEAQFEDGVTGRVGREVENLGFNGLV